MRDKWDAQHGEQTYGAMTIDKALAKVTKQYTPNPRKRKSGKRNSRNRPTPSGPINGEPAPGTIDPTTDRLILSTKRTLPTADSFIKQFHRHADGRTLHHYAGMLVAWRDNRYVEIEDDGMRHRLLPWMHEAVRMVPDKDAGWVPEGWRRLRARGHFVQPSSVENAVRDMEDLSSPVGAFVRERCEVGSGLRIWIDDLYAAWKEWCEADGRISVTTKQTFGRDLMAAVPGVSRRCGTNGARFYQGIGLKGVLA